MIGKGDQMEKNVDTLEWQNARIENTFLGYEHGVITISISCKGDGWAQAFGGRALNHPTALKNCINGVLVTTRVDGWSALKGTLIRVGRQACRGEIVAIRSAIEDWPVFWPGDDLNENPGLIREG